jgi:hypothetical protein
MRLPDLDQIIAGVLVADDHPEITRVEIVPTSERPADHTRLVVTFTDGSTAVVMVRRVEGTNVPRHADFELPAAVVGV